MAREFTRIEFEGGGVVVVKAPASGNGFIVRGNRASGWDRFNATLNLSRDELVDELITRTGKKVERKLTYAQAH